LQQPRLRCLARRAQHRSPAIAAMWALLNSNSSSWNPVERLIFPAPVPSYEIDSYPGELLLIPKGDGSKVPCLFLPFRHARFLVLYFHANAEDLGSCYSFCKTMRDLFQVHVLAVEYPGYGICPGKPDEAGIMENAKAAMKFATDTIHWPCEDIKLFGRSLGTGPCVQLAAAHDVAGVILVSPFTSIKSLFRAQVGALADIVEDRFPSSDLVPAIVSPTLIIHGQQDNLIPLSHGKALYDLLNTRKMLVCPATMGHNHSLLKDIGVLVLPMTQFFSLPDYSFDDLEIPEWCFPENARRKASEDTESSPPSPGRVRVTAGSAAPSPTLGTPRLFASCFPPNGAMTLDGSRPACRSGPGLGISALSADSDKAGAIVVDSN